MLDERLRAELQKPFGALCSKDNCAERLRAYNKIITVGDITTYNVVRSGVVPDICIIDGITMRKRVPDAIHRTINAEPRTVYEVDNPSGSISDQLRDAVRSSMEMMSRSERVRIVVHGEEDLAVIPAVLEAPLGAVVVYGQPNEGMVIIDITPEKKKNATRLLRQIQRV